MTDGIGKDEIERSFKLINTERRARALVDSAVANAMRSPPMDERDFAKYASYVALDATACLMRQIYEDDAELRAIRAERDRYKEIAEQALQSVPPRMFIPSSDSDGRPKAGDAKQAPLATSAGLKGIAQKLTP